MTSWLVFNPGDIIAPQPTPTPSPLPVPFEPTLPAAVKNWLAFELPYHLAPNTTELGVVAVRPNAQQLDATITIDEQAQSGVAAYQATKITLLADLTIDSDSIVLSAEPQGTLLLIGEELVQLTGDTVLRGVADTIPTAYPRGTDVWDLSRLWESSRGSTAPNVAALTVGVFSNTADASYPFNSSIERPLLLKNRQQRPLPPANIMINERYYPTAATNDIVLTYSGRNRFVQQSSGLLTGWYNSSGQTPENGVEIVVNVQPALGAEPRLGEVIKVEAAESEGGRILIDGQRIFAAIGSTASDLLITARTRLGGSFSFYTFRHQLHWNYDAGIVLRFKDSAARGGQLEHALQFAALPPPDAPPTPERSQNILRFGGIHDATPSRFHTLSFDELQIEVEPSMPVPTDLGWAVA